MALDGEQPSIFFLCTIESKTMMSSSKRCFERTLTVGELKVKLEKITKIPIDHMRIDLYNSSKNFLETLHNETNKLTSYPINNTCTLRVVDASKDVTDKPHKVITDSCYSQLKNTIRDYKKQHKLGRFAGESKKKFFDADGKPIKRSQYETAIAKELKEKFEVGTKCEVNVVGKEKRSGRIAFIDHVLFNTKYPFVGVEYDEPIGANDGSVQGIHYFHCSPNHGSFVPPSCIEISERDRDVNHYQSLFGTVSGDEDDDDDDDDDDEGNLRRDYSTTSLSTITSESDISSIPSSYSRKKWNY
ncbi:hypothetical protein SNEBB_011473 [Seison nebaliae]|nr:hypothetical protein SNEBB_011473 [Seison nebaliae]